MANKSSAKKEIRKNVKRYAHNKSIKSRVRTFSNVVKLKIESLNIEEAIEAVRKYESNAMKAAKTGIFNKMSISRRVSNFVKKIKNIQAK